MTKLNNYLLFTPSIRLHYVRKFHSYNSISFSSCSVLLTSDDDLNYASSVPDEHSIPDLEKSRAAGAWDSSTVPDTDTNPEANALNRKAAESMRSIHRQCLKLFNDGRTNITSVDGQPIIDLSSEDEGRIISALDNASYRNNAQAIHDTLHKDILRAYADSREKAEIDKENEIQGLKNHLYAKLLKYTAYQEKVFKIRIGNDHDKENKITDMRNGLFEKVLDGTTYKSEISKLDEIYNKM